MIETWAHLWSARGIDIGPWSKSWLLLCWISVLKIKSRDDNHSKFLLTHEVTNGQRIQGSPLALLVAMGPSQWRASPWPYLERVSRVCWHPVVEREWYSWVESFWLFCCSELLISVVLFTDRTNLYLFSSWREPDSFILSRKVLLRSCSYIEVQTSPLFDLCFFGKLLVLIKKILTAYFNSFPKQL